MKSLDSLISCQMAIILELVETRISADYIYHISTSFETVRCDTNQRETLFQNQSNEQNQMSKSCHFFSQYKEETYIFTFNKPSLTKKSKDQQYFHCFIVCIVGPYALQFSFQQNVVTCLKSKLERHGLLEGRRLLEGGAYFSVDAQRCSTFQRSGTYQRRHVI